MIQSLPAGSCENGARRADGALPGTHGPRRQQLQGGREETPTEEIEVSGGSFPGDDDAVQLLEEEGPPELFDAYEAEQEVADDLWGNSGFDAGFLPRAAEERGGIGGGGGGARRPDPLGGDPGGEGSRIAGSYQWGGSSGSGGHSQGAAESARKRARVQEARRQDKREREQEASAIEGIAERLTPGESSRRQRLEEVARRVQARHAR